MDLRRGAVVVLIAAWASHSDATIPLETFRDRSRTVRPAGTCESLRSLSSGFVIEKTTTSASVGTEICIVLGRIEPEVRFEVALPAVWNSRLFMFGNGGTAGESLAAPNRVQLRDRAAHAGFVVTQTNTGHDAATEPGYSFAAHEQKLVDFAHRAVHLTVGAAKTIAAAYYGKAPARSYFSGCSTGGRQGLIAAQRYPDDFDGIVAGGPTLNLTALNVSNATLSRLVAAAEFSPAKVEYLSDLLMRRCDALDGVRDGVIENPRRCDVDLASEVRGCTPREEQLDCLTGTQRKALEGFDRKLVSLGRTIYPAFAMGGGLLARDVDSRSATIAYWIGQDAQPSAASSRGAYFDALFPRGSSMTTGWRSLEPAQILDIMQPVTELLSPENPDLTRFRNRGGKLIMYHGWSEPQIAPDVAIGYYENVRNTMGDDTAKFARLFMIPGMLHCRGGAGTDWFDLTTPLIAWVERGEAPDSVLAARRIAGKIARTRPLCPYPQAAAYLRRGSTDDAINFRCR